jgi:hypothetical protein
MGTTLGPNLWGRALRFSIYKQDEMNKTSKRQTKMESTCRNICQCTYLSRRIFAMSIHSHH